MRQAILQTSVLAAWCGTLSSAAFMSSTSSWINTRRPPQRPISTPLSLVPEQGNQLVAAYTAALSKYQEDYEDEDNNEEEEGENDEEYATASSTASKARNFVQRAFSLPSTHKKGKGPVTTTSATTTTTTKTATASTTTTTKSHDDTNQDVVLFPLVGFTFCRNGNRIVPLPTQSNVSCRLPRYKTKDEDVYGWYSPVCKLNMYAAEDAEYCTQPNRQDPTGTPLRTLNEKQQQREIHSED